MSVDAFISYSSHDRDRVLAIADELQRAGLSLWIDRQKIPGGGNYGLEIVQGVRACSVFILACSSASLRSRNVRAEIQLAWKYDKPYLPILLEQASVPDQLQYWLEGSQHIEVLTRSPGEWLPEILRGCAHVGIRVDPEILTKGGTAFAPTKPAGGIDGLWEVARFTDMIWPVSADQVGQGFVGGALRDLGAPQDNVRHRFRLGNRVRLVIEAERVGSLLLLNQGTTGKVYCLCPSHFAPQTTLRKGRTVLPQAIARYDSFIISGAPGRERLLALITDEPLNLDWLPSNPEIPAQELGAGEVDMLLARVKALPETSWIALATYFDVSN